MQATQLCWRRHVGHLQGVGSIQRSALGRIGYTMDRAWEQREQLGLDRDGMSRLEIVEVIEDFQHS